MKKLNAGRHLKKQNAELRDLNRQQRELTVDIGRLLEKERFDCKYWIACHTVQKLVLSELYEEISEMKTSNSQLKFKLEQAQNAAVALIVISIGFGTAFVMAVLS
jgi:hypothetical protein